MSVQALIRDIPQPYITFILLALNARTRSVSSIFSMIVTAVTVCASMTAPAVPIVLAVGVDDHVVEAEAPELAGEAAARRHHSGSLPGQLVLVPVPAAAVA